MAYTSASAQDRLDAVREAIAKCLGSQEYSIRGRRQQMAQLKDLYAMEQSLQKEVQEAAGGAQMGSIGRYHPE